MQIWIIAVCVVILAIIMAVSITFMTHAASWAGYLLIAAAVVAVALGVTAIISFITALTLIVLIPLALQLPLQVASLDKKYTTERKLCMFLTSIMRSRKLGEAQLMQLVLQTLRSIFPDAVFDLKVHDYSSTSPRVSRPSTMLPDDTMHLLHNPEVRPSFKSSHMYVRMSGVHSLILQPVLYYENQQFFDQVSLLLQMETQHVEV